MAKLMHKEQSYTGGGSSGLLPHIVITSEAENTITVTTPSGSTITPTSTSSGVWECDVDEYGIYTIDATYDGHDAEEIVTVDTVKVYPVEIHVTTVPDGKTITPTDDIATWLACGQITGKSYTTLSQVLADAETYERLLSDSNACDYMARSTTWASTICADADAMMRLGKYDYACDALLDADAWFNAVMASSYRDYVLPVSVPTMTSNTTPSGVASCGTRYDPAFDAYKAFDGVTNNYENYWCSNLSANDYLQYEFPTAVCIKAFAIEQRDPAGIEDYEILASNDGFVSDIHKLAEGTFAQGSSWTQAWTYVKLSNNSNYKSYRIFCKSTYSGGGSGNLCIIECDFLGRKTSATDIIVTAHGGDTVYYMENGSPVPLTTADSDTGIGTVDWSDLPKGAITLYSSTAKNPSDLTADYSKTVYITEYTTQIYLMPDNALYWWGYENNLIDATTANGWTMFEGGSSANPTYNTNSVTLGTSASSQNCAIATKNPISGSKVHAIGKKGSANSYLCIYRVASKTFANRTDVVDFPANTNMNYVNNSKSMSNIYIALWEFNFQSSTVYAFWYE